MMTPIIIFFAAFFVHCVYFIIFSKGINLKKTIVLSGKIRKVSVIIAARNEEENIARTLTCLVNQDYPQGMLEIIVANDESIDRTAEIVATFAAKFSHIKLLNTTGRAHVRSPKKNALEQAIKTASSDILLFTDADCYPPAGWVKGMVGHFQEDTAMVAGFSHTALSNWKQAGLLQKFEHFDFIFLFFTTLGALASGRPFSCSGQNLAYTRQAWEKVNGFQKIAAFVSGDDVNLMQLMRKNGLKIAVSLYPPTFMKTKPIENWGAFIRQRSRWASNYKWQLWLNREFFFYLSCEGLVVLGMFVLPWISIKLWVLYVFLTFSSEYLFFRANIEKIGMTKKLAAFFPVWFLFLPIYGIISTFRGIFGLFAWKR